MVKKKIKIVVRFIQWHIYNKQVRNGFFFHRSEISAVRHAYVTQSSLKRPIHVTRDLVVGQESRCGLSKFHCRNEVTQGHKEQAIKL